MVLKCSACESEKRLLDIFEPKAAVSARFLSEIAEKPENLVNMLSKDQLQRGLRTTTLGKKMYVFESIDSTNNCARTLADAGGEEGIVVISEYQTNGRGRHGRAWNSDPNSNLLFSVLLRPEISKAESGILPFLAAVSVARSVESMTGTAVECKWPNDLLLNGKKLAGILLENSVQEDEVLHSIIGIGINVNQRSFDPSLAQKATSLVNETGLEFDRRQLLQKVLEELESNYNQLHDHKKDLLDEWLSRCHILGRSITVRHHDEELTGTVKGVSEDGALLLETPSGERSLFAGDVQVV